MRRVDLVQDRVGCRLEMAVLLTAEAPLRDEFHFISHTGRIQMTQVLKTPCCLHTWTRVGFFSLTENLTTTFWTGSGWPFQTLLWKLASHLNYPVTLWFRLNWPVFLFREFSGIIHAGWSYLHNQSKIFLSSPKLSWPFLTRAGGMQDWWMRLWNIRLSWRATVYEVSWSPLASYNRAQKEGKFEHDIISMFTPGSRQQKKRLWWGTSTTQPGSTVWKEDSRLPHSSLFPSYDSQVSYTACSRDLKV